MRSLPTPNYVLMEDVYVILSVESKKLDVGSFVRPINIYYLPQHIKDNPRLYPINLKTHTYCFTFYGIVAIPLDKIRKVS